MPEQAKRMKLKVLEAGEVKPVGSHGAKKYPVKCKGIDSQELWYFTFSETIAQHFKGDIDVDVVTSEREYEGNTYVDRKIVQLYVDGQLVSGQGKGGGWRGKSPEELEMQRRAFALSYAKDVAIAFINRGEAVKNETILKDAEQFDSFLAGQHWPTKKPVESKPQAPQQTTEPLKTGVDGTRDPTTIKNLGDLFTACAEDFGLKTRAAVLKELGISSQTEIADPADAYAKVAAVR